MNEQRTNSSGKKGKNQIIKKMLNNIIKTKKQKQFENTYQRFW